MNEDVRIKTSETRTTGTRTLRLAIEPLVIGVTGNDDSFRVHLADGRTLEVPLSWYPRLQAATAEERQHWQILGQGYAIEWPDVDEHIGIESLLAGCRSGESQDSFRRWVESRSVSRTN